MSTESKLIPFTIKGMHKATGFETRTGASITDVTYLESRASLYQIIGVLGGNIASYTTEGRTGVDYPDDHPDQLMMRVDFKTGWVNVYEGELYKTEVEAENLIQADTGFIRTIKVEY